MTSVPGREPLWFKRRMGHLQIVPFVMMVFIACTYRSKPHAFDFFQFAGHTPFWHEIRSETGWPDWPNFRPLGQCLLWAFFAKLHRQMVMHISELDFVNLRKIWLFSQEYGHMYSWAVLWKRFRLFSQEKLSINFDKIWIGLHFGQPFHFNHLVTLVRGALKKTSARNF
jgi:hypothetical protein